MAQKRAVLSSDLVTRKGDALPTVTESAPELAVLPRRTNKPIKDGSSAMTVRLDPDRYEALRLLTIKTRTSGQQILIQALDAVLEKNAHLLKGLR